MVQDRRHAAGSVEVEVLAGDRRARRPAPFGETGGILVERGSVPASGAWLIRATLGSPKRSSTSRIISIHIEALLPDLNDLELPGKFHVLVIRIWLIWGLEPIVPCGLLSVGGRDIAVK
jgi:hypothetical protein